MPANVSVPPPVDADAARCAYRANLAARGATLMRDTQERARALAALRDPLAQEIADLDAKAKALRGRLAAIDLEAAVQSRADEMARAALDAELLDTAPPAIDLAVAAIDEDLERARKVIVDERYERDFTTGREILTHTSGRSLNRRLTALMRARHALVALKSDSPADDVAIDRRIAEITGAVPALELEPVEFR